MQVPDASASGPDVRHCRYPSSGGRDQGQGHSVRYRTSFAWKASMRLIGSVLAPIC